MEIIVVDDASTDGSEDAVKAEVPGVRYIRHEARRFPAYSVNEGIRSSRGEYVLVVDDDNVLSRTAIQEVARAFAGDDTIAVVGLVSCYLAEPTIVIYAGCSLRSLTRRVEFHFAGAPYGSLPSGLIEVDFCHNCVAIRRDLALRVGLVDSERFTHFSYEMALQASLRRAHYRVVASPAAVTWHDIPRDPSNARTFGSKQRLYYSIRSKIQFEKLFDSSLGRLTFSLSIPVMFVAYLERIIRAIRPPIRWRALMMTVFDGYRDGLFNRTGARVLDE